FVIPYKKPVCHFEPAFYFYFYSIIKLSVVFFFQGFDDIVSKRVIGRWDTKFFSHYDHTPEGMSIPVHR
ncbi:MAG: hypothetical protein LKJ91_09010, partial [Acidaminococcus sp.]|nr:hypothetical protein [Acidaminococcus sp.]MCI2115521.1 hypothetical protein [Acidaminococcus sp.]MCI2117653.1 hypothetical protein [Acidaminococcus sp.]